ncbi:MAG: hypothetical protein PHW62_00410 [Candidatus Ratteibacteria bacterium]|nr:hypothetical protein [Candidatus Ratteibacteria bacterium]
MAKEPKYKGMPAEELPPYQLYKLWQKVTGYSSMDRFGSLPRAEALEAINRAKGKQPWRPFKENKKGTSGWQEAADDSGKAPEHVIAANKNKTDNVSRIPMYKPPKVVQRLIHENKVYNPFFINIGGRSYELKNIIVYKKNGDLISNGRGWFGSNNSLDYFEVPETTKRLKVKLDGSTFIVPKKKEWFERHDTTPHAILYIPYEYFDFGFCQVHVCSDRLSKFVCFVGGVRLLHKLL